MKTSYLLIFVFISQLLCFGQTPYTSLIIMPQGYSISTLNGFGTSRLINNSSNLNSLNPAALDNFKKTSLGLSYSYESKIENGWLGGMGGERVKNYFPNSAGLIYPFKSLRFGFSFNQLYNWQLDIGKVSVTTNPDGLVKYYEPKYRVKVYTYSFLASFTFTNIFGEDNFSFGARFSRNRLYYYQSIMYVGAEGIIYQNNYSFGIIYKHFCNNTESIQAGITYDSPVEFTGIMNYKENKYPDLITNRPIEFYRMETWIRSRVPGKLSLDYNLDVITKLKILGGFNYVFWNSSYQLNYKDQIEINGSILYPYNSTVSTSLGFYSTSVQFKEDLMNVNSKLNAFYLTGGIVVDYNMLSFDMSIADSHLFSGKGRKQTIGKFALAYQL